MVEPEPRYVVQGLREGTISHALIGDHIAPDDEAWLLIGFREEVQERLPEVLDKCLAPPEELPPVSGGVFIGT
jgi:hypothetical protein